MVNLYLLTGKRISNDKLLVETIYNLDHPDNQNIDTSVGVVVEEQISVSNPLPGKGYLLYVNPLTLEQWFEEFDIPKTPEQLMQEKIEELEQRLQVATDTIDYLLGV